MNAYEQGYHSFFDGEDRSLNPYHPNHEEKNHLKWDNGWLAGSALPQCEEDLS